MKSDKFTHLVVFTQLFHYYIYNNFGLKLMQHAWHSKLDIRMRVLVQLLKKVIRKLVSFLRAHDLWHGVTSYTHVTCA